MYFFIIDCHVPPSSIHAVPYRTGRNSRDVMLTPYTHTNTLASPFVHLLALLLHLLYYSTYSLVQYRTGLLVNKTRVQFGT
mmetsp:Transcript_23459/g.26157  ORF Transcript_23459/g.26157 Transcript_23459/m.26157 type:complete len:81 (-) Transcript_23459:242-484(-)